MNLSGRVQLLIAGQELELPAADISVSGLGVLLEAGVLGDKPNGEVGFCRIESVALPAVLEAYVSVMRIRRLGAQRLVGLRFESIGDAELALIQKYRDGCRATPAPR